MLTAVVVYLSVLVLIGTRRSRQVKTGDDFLVAGRTLPARVLVFTLLATWIGSGSLFAGAGLGYRDRIGIYLPKSLESYTGIFATLGIGAAYVPLDPSAPAARIH